jgi:Na+-transporting methylmalonyl-CoA/oxaloacetate decarboxylase beta subunit
VFADRIKTAFLVLWLSASGLLFPLLLVPFALLPDAIVVRAPDTGLIASLVMVSEGRLNAAVHESPAGIPVFAALVWNECVAVWYTLGEMWRIWRQLRRGRKRLRAEEMSCKL